MCRQLAVVKYCAVLLLCACSAFRVHAQSLDMHCTPDGVYLDMFQGSYGGFFAFPEDPAALPIGARVGPLREVNLRYLCMPLGLMGEIDIVFFEFGVGMNPASGIYKHIPTDTYTNADLEALGLGYRMWWHEPMTAEASTNGGPQNPVPHSNSDPTKSAPPDHWYEGNFADIGGMPVGRYLRISTRVIFFKINDNFQNTNGMSVPVNVFANLFRFYIAQGPNTNNRDPATFGIITSDEYAYNLQFSNFESARRICTPLVDQNITLDDVTKEQLPTSPGVVSVGAQNFSLTFNCPYMAYFLVGFKLDPTYGVLDANEGVMGIRQGAGYAQGVGVQFQAENVRTGWSQNQNATSPFQVLRPNQDYFIPWFNYNTSGINENPATANRTRTVNFKVAYYRTSASLVGGDVESKVTVRFVYQ